MPVHNGGNYLRPAVQSILDQRGVDIELILVDDHSTDDVINLLPQDHRIRLFQSPQKGLIPALNFGIEQARGFWVARMDADDIAEPLRLKKQHDFLLANPTIGICGAQVNIFKDDGDADQGYKIYQRWINGLKTPQQIEQQFFVESAIPHPTVLLRRDTLESLGGYQDNGWPEDYDLWCRAHLKGIKFAKPEGKLLHWRDYQHRTSRQDTRYCKGAFLQCKAFYLAQWLKQKGLQSATIWGTGPTGLKIHDYLEQNGIQIDGFVDINPKLYKRRKRDKSVTIVSQKISLSELESIHSISIIAVSSRGAREKINEALHALKWQINRDYILAA